MKRLGEMLDTAVGKSMAASMALAPVWKRAVGETVASLTAPVKVDKGTLHVMVFDSLWVSELTFMAGEILPKLEKHGITALKFFHKSSPLKKTQPPVKRRKVGAEEQRFIDNYTRGIGNEELRDSFRRAMTAYFEQHTIADFFAKD